MNVAATYRLRSRGMTYTFLVGVTVGLLVAGFAVPLVFGEGLSGESGGPTPGAASTVGTFEGGAANSEAATSTTVTGSAPAQLGGATATTAPRSAEERPSQGDSDPATTGEEAPAGSEELKASDIGVTPTTVKVGFLLIDLSSAERAGLDVGGGIGGKEDQERAFQVIVDDINARGGIHGREITPIYESFDPLSDESMRAKCLKMTEEHEVFAVVAYSGYLGPGVLCVTEEHNTPLIVRNPQPTLYHQRSGGLLLSAQQASKRMTLNWVFELDRRGLLHGELQEKKIGILGDETQQNRAAADDLEESLERFGYEVTHRSRLSGDLSTAQSQIPVEVQQMRSKGVNTVLMMTILFNTQSFVQQADQQGWRPTWLVTDWNAATLDSAAQNMPDSYDGTLGLTGEMPSELRVGEPERQVDAECRKRYEQATEEKLERDADSLYTTVMIACAEVAFFEAGARAAGPDLTRATFLDGIDRLSSLPVPYLYDGGFRPNKHDYVDTLRAVRWFKDCKCWKPVEGTRPVEFR